MCARARACVCVGEGGCSVELESLNVHVQSFDVTGYFIHVL